MPEQATPAEVARAMLTPVCSIGASAGGVGALQTLFRQLPDNLGLAYVVIVHLAPDHPSSMRDILGMCTQMPVLQVRDSPVLKPNSVYVIAPDSELVIEGDNVSARPFSEPRGRRAPIDMFFRSIAAARGDGVAMVLSPAPGRTGRRAYAPSRKRAASSWCRIRPRPSSRPCRRTPSRPGPSTSSLPIARLGRAPARGRAQQGGGALARHGRERPTSCGASWPSSAIAPGHDFSSYKRATVMRRVTRRMQVCRLDSLAGLFRAAPDHARGGQGAVLRPADLGDHVLP